MYSTENQICRSYRIRLIYADIVLVVPKKRDLTDCSLLLNTWKNAFLVFFFLHCGASPRIRVMASPFGLRDYIQAHHTR